MNMIKVIVPDEEAAKDVRAALACAKHCEAKLPNHFVNIIDELRNNIVVEHKPNLSELHLSFDKFWKMYPKKHNKNEAYKIWEKLCPNDDLVNTIIRAVETLSKTKQWTDEDGRYVPKPAVWLQDKRWKAVKEDKWGRSNAKDLARRQRLLQKIKES